MFRGVLGAIGLAGIFGKSKEAPEIEQAQSPYDIGDIKAVFIPELEGMEGPLLHVVTTKSSGVVNITGQTEEIIVADQISGDEVIIPADEGNFEFPENRTERVFELAAYNTFSHLRQKIQTWEVEGNVTRIGGNDVPDIDAKHIITLVPAGFSDETMLERIQLDQHSGEEGWDYLKQKVADLESRDPGPQPET